MGQNEIYTILFKSNKWMTNKELQKITGVKTTAVNRSLNQMIRWKEVERRKLFRNEYEYKVIKNV